MEGAPFRQLPDAAAAPAEAFFLRADDGVRLRVALWRASLARAEVQRGVRAEAQGEVRAGAQNKAQDGARDGMQPEVSATPGGRGGTVLIFPGRTEYCEKYAPVARVLTAAGHDVLAIDWRGQGASARLTADPRIGHVGDFRDYQHDVAALLRAADALGLGGPRFMLAHSMGGAIGMRALTGGLGVAAAAFSAPMWGMAFGPFPERLARPVVRGLTALGTRVGLGARQLPGRSGVLDTAFSANRLTGDADTYARLLREAAAWPELMIGPPSIGWVRAALAECAAVARMASPRLPGLASWSGRERFVLPGPIRARLARWPGARLIELPEARHEALFEAPPARDRFIDAVLALFAAA